MNTRARARSRTNPHRFGGQYYRSLNDISSTYVPGSAAFGEGEKKKYATNGVFELVKTGLVNGKKRKLYHKVNNTGKRNSPYTAKAAGSGNYYTISKKVSRSRIKRSNSFGGMYTSGLNDFVGPVSYGRSARYGGEKYYFGNDVVNTDTTANAHANANGAIGVADFGLKKKPRTTRKRRSSIKRKLTTSRPSTPRRSLRKKKSVRF
jgi:hypothetical protein